MEKQNSNNNDENEGYSIGEGRQDDGKCHYRLTACTFNYVDKF